MWLISIFEIPFFSFNFLLHPSVRKEWTKTRQSKWSSWLWSLVKAVQDVARRQVYRSWWMVFIVPFFYLSLFLSFPFFNNRQTKKEQEKQSARC